MPHIVIEYSNNSHIEAKIGAVMKAGHDASLASRLFSEGDIKVRAYLCSDYLVAGAVAPFMHVTVKLLSGRDITVKKQLTFAILEAIQAVGIDVTSLSVEAVDIEKASYTKIVK